MSSQDLEKDLAFEWENAVFEYETAGCRTPLKGYIKGAQVLPGRLCFNRSRITFTWLPMYLCVFRNGKSRVQSRVYYRYRAGLLPAGEGQDAFR